VDDSAPDDFRDELAALEAAEAQLSAERRRLHQQIDFGFSTAETRAREREVSDERRRVHQRIDSLRLLRAKDSPAGSEEDTGPADPAVGPLRQWSGIPSEVARDSGFADEAEP
jgi:hypothetical protein